MGAVYLPYIFIGPKHKNTGLRRNVGVGKPNLSRIHVVYGLTYREKAKNIACIQQYTSNVYPNFFKKNGPKPH